MADIHWTFLSSGYRFLHWLWLMYSMTKLTLYSLFYNDFADKYYVGDTCMEPMFWFVDHFTKILGPICVAAVIFLSSSLIIIAYVIGLPFYLRQNFFVLIIALTLGHWLLICVVYYYYMAFTTAPGFPPQGAMISEAVSICKRCIAPKPPRTHHCIVCNRCILKMDHHCPWLNNCVGHFNHRYFFMFCAYACTGIVFVIVFGIPVAYDHFFGNPDHSRIAPAVVNIIKEISNHLFYKYSLLQRQIILQPSLSTNSTSDINEWPETMYHSCIVYAAFLCVVVLFVLGGLLVWHARLISRGETSIESHINKKETARLLKEGKIYENPYNLGFEKNWKIFLCIGYNGRPWWHIFLPFAEEPLGDGLQWSILNSVEALDDEKQIVKACFIKMS
ncbi:palmitoyltransferase ZDHHC16-like [Argiope bruennichi]|uniref:Palmitoyltransferase n=1 Tax=Argiope bruennichi TaxID=94029 RepID=A0A8T0FK27_ARGBR|nr:palmitoyltransferase ZDHHC16-like [Argiope bruennichi]XP_055930373.1 palmitoyltransferase ZDHHC16-like [Argiope bruennichi]KAF8790802.1 Palmitoyltransferase ZDHHC16 like protein [Argiope bruennichi]